MLYTKWRRRRRGYVAAILLLFDVWVNKKTGSPASQVAKTKQNTNVKTARSKAVRRKHNRKDKMARPRSRPN